MASRTRKKIKNKQRRMLPRHFWVTVKYHWKEVGTFNQVLILLGFVFLSSTVATTAKVINDQLKLREIRCLSMNIYHEARGEPIKGKYGVAEVTMNRVNSKRYPSDVCRVVFQKGWSRRHQRYITAFSWTNDELTDIPKESKAWKESVKIANDVYNEKTAKRFKKALFYHADYVNPRWAKGKVIVAKVGRHIFYE